MLNLIVMANIVSESWDYTLVVFMLIYQDMIILVYFLARTPGLDKTSKKKESKPSASASEITLLISET
jgi:hypothetical protein